MTATPFCAAQGMALPRFDEVLQALREYEDGGDAGPLAGLRAELAAPPADALAPGEYPDVEDPAFHRRLQRIRDLYALPDPAEVLRAAGAPPDRQLAKHQRFVKAFLAPRTGYNGLLLVHAVGSGKTCAAVTVAEMYRGVMARPALVLTRTSVRAEFQRELHAGAAFADGAWTAPLGCAGARYRKALRAVRSPDPAAMRAALDAATRAGYEFLGYEAFANQADLVARDLPALRAAYSSRVIVVDEAHVLRSDDAHSKRSAALLELVLRECSNVKLLLMSATPMYDRPQEIVFLLNLLRANDGRPPLDAADFFEDGDTGRLARPDGEARLRRAATGYVSYVRGGSPRLYPTVLDAHVAAGEPPAPWPTRASDGTPAVGDPPDWPLVRSELAGDHAALVAGLLTRAGAGDDPRAGAGDDPRSAAPASQASNVAFPVDGGGRLAYGADGLAATFAKTTAAGLVQYAYRPGRARMLAEPLLSAHAPKIARVVADVLASTGVAFVYSNFVSGGAVPVALALEHAGVTRFGGPPLLAGARTGKARGKYVLLTGQAGLAADVQAALREVNAPENARGERVRVVVATMAAMEGINFRCVRDVHVLDGWWNASRPQQVLGRATRLLSHRALPADEQNVTVHYHAAALPGDREGVDHAMYRVAGDKRAAIGDVLRVLRDESVDCAWNAADLYVEPTGERATHVTSRGARVDVPLGDHAGSAACFFGACTRPCAARHLLEPAQRDAALFQPLADDVELVRLVLEALFATRPAVRPADALAAMPGAEADLVEASLVELVERGARVTVAGRTGRLVAAADFFAVEYPDADERAFVEDVVPLDDGVLEAAPPPADPRPRRRRRRTPGRGGGGE